jgi:hypothetical protein
MMMIGIRVAWFGVRSQAKRELRASGMVSPFELLPSPASSTWLLAALSCSRQCHLDQSKDLEKVENVSGRPALPNSTEFAGFKVIIYRAV